MKLLPASLLIVSALCLSAHVASAATVIYNFSNTSPTNPGDTISGANLTSGAGISPTINGVGRIPTGQTDTTLDTAVTNNDFFQFDITTQTSNVGFSEFSYINRSNVANTSATYLTRVRVSLDNFATFVYSADNSNVAFNSATTHTEDLTGVTELQNLANATVVNFRIFFADNTSSNQQLTDDVSITAAVVPEPTTGLMLLGSTGLLMILRRRRR